MNSTGELLTAAGNHQPLTWETNKHQYLLHLYIIRVVVINEIGKKLLSMRTDVNI